MRASMVPLSLAACLVLSACSAVGGLASLLPSSGAAAGTRTAAPTSGTATPEATLAERHPIDVCAIVTMADARSKSPFQTALAHLNEQVNYPFGCGWTSSVDPPSKRVVSIDLIANSLGTAEEAAKEFSGRQQDFRDLDFAARPTHQAWVTGPSTTRTGPGTTWARSRRRANTRSALSFGASGWTATRQRLPRSSASRPRMS